LIKEEKYKDAVAFRVDFDREKDFLRAHRGRYQSTLIVFKGRKEAGRSLAELDKAKIQALFSKGL
jgi:hypothetical protein